MIYPRQGSVDSTNIAVSILLLMFSFSEIATASLSGIDPGYPRFTAVSSNIDYQNTGVNTFNLGLQNTSSRVYWQDAESSSRELVKQADFHVQVGLDTSTSSDPQVLAGSTFELFGKVDSFGTGYGLLFSADINDLFWTTGSQGIIEFVLDGATMSGAACTLGFCSFSDEVLQLKTNNFNGDWTTDFSKSARSVSTIPLPEAVWLFVSALITLGGLKRRRA